MRAYAVLAFALTVGSAGAASAAVIDPINVLQHVNALIYTNATTAADIQGEAIIGGNFSGATMDNNFTPLTGYGALTVYGSTSGNQINLGNGGSAYVAGTKGEHINFNGGGNYLTTAPPNTINDFETAMNGFSTSLSQLAATSTLPTTGNNEVLLAHPNSKGVAIFDITAAQLDAIPSYSINRNGAKTVLFNVSGSAIAFSGNEQGSITGTAGDIIWNFYQATSVTLGTQIGGKILAPTAAVTNNNQIDGSLVAKSWTGRGELHSNLFTGASPLAVPEPGTWALMMIGIGAIGAGLRLRRGKTAAAEEAA